MRFPIRMMVALLSALVSATAFAGTVTGATITGIGVDTQLGSMAFISISLSKTGNPACNTNSWSFVLPLTTALQNQMFAQLLAARVAQTPISLTGNGLCDTFSNVETLVYIIL
jgi:hypothetical protein